jgi:predicted lipoprotein with Yx(FWY)xxD motif
MTKAHTPGPGRKTRVNRTLIPLAAVLASAASVSALAGPAAGAPSAGASQVAKVQLRHTSLGKILVDSSGFTLYRFTKDGRNQDTCVKISQCLSTWPALTTSGKPLAGPGVRASLLSTIKLPNGKKQVTYAGHALYRYFNAEEHGETFYVGAMQFGGIWYGVNGAGNTVK